MSKFKTLGFGVRNWCETINECLFSKLISGVKIDVRVDDDSLKRTLREVPAGIDID